MKLLKQIASVDSGVFNLKTIWSLLSYCSPSRTYNFEQLINNWKWIRKTNNRNGKILNGCIAWMHDENHAKIEYIYFFGILITSVSFCVYKIEIKMCAECNDNVCLPAFLWTYRGKHLIALIRYDTVVTHARRLVKVQNLCARRRVYQKCEEHKCKQRKTHGKYYCVFLFFSFIFLRKESYGSFKNLIDFIGRLCKQYLKYETTTAAAKLDENWRMHVQYIGFERAMQTNPGSTHPLHCTLNKVEHNA